MANQKEKRTFKDFKASIDEYFNKCEEDNINAMPLSRSEKSKLFELLYPTYKNDIEWR